MNKRKTKILIVTMDYPPPIGGIQVFTYDLDHMLKKNGYDVKLLNFDGRNTNTYKYLKPIDFFYTPSTHNAYFSLNRILNPFSFLQSSGGLRDFVFKNMIYRTSRQVIREFKPDIIHIMKNDLYSAIYGAKVPYIVSCHSSISDLYDAPHIKYSLDHAARIHCVSHHLESLVKSLSKRGLKEISVIHNYVDLEKYKHKCTIRKNRIITISRITKQKNIKTLLEAYSFLPKNIKDKYEYMIIGDGPELPKLKWYVNKKGIKNIIFTGEISDQKLKIQLLSQAKIFILCPTVYNGVSEAFGIVYLEAQAIGLPVICSNIGGVKEAVGKSGVYVKDELNPKEIANNINAILTNKELYNRLIIEANKRIAYFGRNIWFQKMLSMYRGVLAKRNLKQKDYPN